MMCISLVGKTFFNKAVCVLCSTDHLKINVICCRDENNQKKDIKFDFTVGVGM